MSSGGKTELDGICIKSAASDFEYNELIYISPGSQGVWFGVFGITAGTVFIDKKMCDGSWQPVASATADGATREVLPVGAFLRIRTVGVGGSPVVEVLPIGGY